MARKKHPGQRNNLDALCKRYNIDNQHREKHGALLDAEILAHLYLAMTGGQNALSLEEAPLHLSAHLTTNEIVNASEKMNLTVIRATEQELITHHEFLNEVEKRCGSALFKEMTEEL